MQAKISTSFLRIQDWAKSDRPREKLLQKGHTGLTNAELIGTLIGSGTKELSAVSLAQLILKHYDNDLSKLAQCSVKELQRFKGMGEAKATAIVSAMALGRRRDEQNRPIRQRLSDARSIYQCIKPDLLDKPVEEFWVILLNRANYLLKKQLISRGGLSSTSADPRVIFGAALEHQAAGLIAVHNHPSGNPEPSSKDVRLTKQLIEAGNALNIPVLDHLIVAGDTYFSFVDEGLLFTSLATMAMRSRA